MTWFRWSRAICRWHDHGSVVEGGEGIGLTFADDVRLERNALTDADIDVSSSNRNRVTTTGSPRAESSVDKVQPRLPRELRAT